MINDNKIEHCNFIERKKNRFNEFIFYFISYTVFFLLAYIFVFLDFHNINASFASVDLDGKTQHLLALKYYSNYLKNIISNLAINGQLSIPEWDLCIGEGNDILMTFGYYVIGDPFTLLSVFFDENNIIICYQLIIFLKMYLAGFAFLIYCINSRKYVGINPLIVSTAIVYCFSYYSIVIGALGHPFFLNPFIYLPLVICGVEKIIYDGKYNLYIISLVFTLISNIYVGYMICLAVFVYTVILIVQSDDKLEKFKSISLSTILSFLISSFIVIPMLYFLLNNSRFGSINISAKWIFDFNVIINNIANLFFANSYNNYLILVGLPIICVPFLILKLQCFKLSHKILLIASLIVSTSCPMFWKIMNCMNYPSNRWNFIIVFVFCFAIVDAYNDINKKNGIADKNILLISLIIFLILLLIEFCVQKQLIIIIPSVILIVTVFILLYPNQNNKLGFLIISFLFIVSSIINVKSRIVLDRWVDGYTNIEKNDTNKLSIICDGLDISNYRISGGNLDWYRNQNATCQISNTQYYWSLVNPNIIEYRRKLGLIDRQPWTINDYDNMTVLTELASVKYVLDNSNNCPYNYEYKKNKKDNVIFENKSPLTYIYFYDTYLREDKLVNANLATYQNVLINTAVVKNELIGIDEATIEDIDNIDYTLSVPEDEKYNIIVNEDSKSIIVMGGAGCIEIDYNRPANKEVYLQLKNFRCYDLNRNKLIKYRSNELDEYDYKSFSIWESANLKKIFRYYSDYDQRGNIHNFSINLSYNDNEVIDEKVFIYFDMPGVYKYDEIILNVFDLEKYSEKIEKLNNFDILFLEKNIDYLKYDINVKEDGIICFSIPYLDGFEIYVNGEKKPKFKVNIKNLGVQVKKGYNKIELRYHRPFSLVSKIFTIIGIILLVLLNIFERFLKSCSSIQSNKKQNNNDVLQLKEGCTELMVIYNYYDLWLSGEMENFK